MPQQPVSQAHHFTMPQQPFQHQQQQQQHFNPHASLSESGLGDNLDQTAMNPYFRQQQQHQQHQQQQQQQQQRGAFGMSYINSPQQMSTPIVMRTKDQLSGGMWVCYMYFSN